MIQPHCRIYLVRHGQTDWNAQGILQGQQDIKLNNEGIVQAEQLREAFRTEAFGAIYASDLARARHTAEIVAEAHVHEVQTHAHLRERYLAHYEGKPRPQAEGVWELGPEVETVDEVRGRFRAQLLEIARSHLGQTVLVVAHSGPIRILLAGEGLQDDTTKPRLQNGAFVVLASDGEGFVLEKTGAVDAASASRAE